VKTLGLDISSTKTGYAVVTDGVLTLHGLIPGIKPDRPGQPEDFTFIERAQHMANEIFKVITATWPDMIFIEQTNLGNSRTDQKLLEFVHFAVLSKIIELKRQGSTRYVDTSQWRSVLQIKLNKDQRLNNKLVKLGKKRGKVTFKHLSVEWANSTYGLQLLKKDHDVADAIALATYGQKKASEPTTAAHDVDKILRDSELVVSSGHEQDAKQ
jgi:Holliday junction resolvasome RuvABC endonuclease subunit